MTSSGIIGVVKDVSEILSNVAAVVGLAIAGVWTFHHFVKGRVFKPRLTLQASARRLHTQTGDFVVCSITVSNVGLSQVQKSTADVVIYGLSRDRDHRGRVSGETILTTHTWIEPAGEVHDEIAIPLPPGTDVLAADFRVRARARTWFGQRSSIVEFSTSVIETMTPQSHPQN